MAAWVNRPRNDGETSIQIKWRMEGEWQTETFTDARLASEFRTAVEMAGHAWPADWIKGEGWRVEEPDPAPDPFILSFTDYFEAQKKRVRRGKLKPYTLHRYRRAYELHLVETLGHLAFREINDEIIGEWIDQEIVDGAAPKSIANHHGLLSSIMKHGAMKMHLRRDNPCAVSELPDLTSATAEARQIRFFRPEEWAVLRAAIGSEFLLLMDLFLATGIRWGEISALRVGDVSFSGEEGYRQANISIVRAWSRRAPDDTAAIHFREGETASWVLGPPKSKRPRWVVVTGDVADRLELELIGRGESEYIFRTANRCPWRYPDFHFKLWTPARKKAQKSGLKKHVTPHMLRHTTVVWALAAGVRVEVISEMIGHTSLQMTYDIYGGLINLHDPALAQAMARAMLHR
jgi:integrase